MMKIRYLKDPESGRLLRKADYPSPIYWDGQHIGMHSIWTTGSGEFFANINRVNEKSKKG